MKLNDAVWGAALLVFSGLLLWHVQGFPPMTGQRIGPAVMPGALAVGFAVCGALLLVRGLRERAAWFTLPAWLGPTRQCLGFGVLVGVNLLYLFAAQRAGFIVVGVVYLAALMAVLRVPVKRALPIALVATLLIHYAFYKLLKVPLPWGWLQPWAW